MSDADLRKYRCRACGRIHWTRRASGCKACGSVHLSLFKEPDNYSLIRDFTHNFSSDLAILSSGKFLDLSLDQAADRYASSLISHVCGPYPMNNLYKLLANEISSLLARACSERDTDAILLDSYSSINYHLDRICRSSKQVTGAVVLWLSNYADSLPDYNASPLMLVIDDDYFLESVCGQQLTKAVLSTTGGHQIKDVIIRAIISSNGYVREMPRPQSGLGVRTYFDYHINVNNAFWNLLQDGVKIVHILILLLKLEMPEYADAVAVATSANNLLSTINKLRREKGEVCVYEAIILFRSTVGANPTVHDVYEYLQKACSINNDCKYYSKSMKICCITEKDCTSIIDFLLSKNIVRETAAQELWVSF